MMEDDFRYLRSEDSLFFWCWEEIELVVLRLHKAANETLVVGTQTFTVSDDISTVPSCFALPIHPFISRLMVLGYWSNMF